MNYLKTSVHMPKLICLAIISLLFSCGENTSLETKKPTIDSFEVGQQLTWDWRRSVDGKILAQGEDYKKVVKYKNTIGFYYGNNDTIPAATILNIEPSKTPKYDWPLKVGKKWKYEIEWENNEGTKGKTSQCAKVVSYDNVTVIGGTFKAYKIEYKGRITNSRGYDNEIVDIWWYAPALNSYIKHTQDDGEGFYKNELIKYSSPSKN